MAALRDDVADEAAGPPVVTILLRVRGAAAKRDGGSLTSGNDEDGLELSTSAKERRVTFSIPQLLHFFPHLAGRWLSKADPATRTTCLDLPSALFADAMAEALSGPPRFEIRPHTQFTYLTVARMLLIEARLLQCERYIAQNLSTGTLLHALQHAHRFRRYHLLRMCYQWLRRTGGITPGYLLTHADRQLRVDVGAGVLFQGDPFAPPPPLAAGSGNVSCTEWLHLGALAPLVEEERARKRAWYAGITPMHAVDALAALGGGPDGRPLPRGAAAAASAVGGAPTAAVRVHPDDASGTIGTGEIGYSPLPSAADAAAAAGASSSAAAPAAPAGSDPAALPAGVRADDAGIFTDVDLGLADEPLVLAGLTTLASGGTVASDAVKRGLHDDSSDDDDAGTGAARAGAASGTARLAGGLSIGPSSLAGGSPAKPAAAHGDAGDDLDGSSASGTVVKKRAPALEETDAYGNPLSSPLAIGSKSAASSGSALSSSARAASGSAAGDASSVDPRARDAAGAAAGVGTCSGSPATAAATTSVDGAAGGIVGGIDLSAVPATSPLTSPSSLFASTVPAPVAAVPSAPPLASAAAARDRFHRRFAAYGEVGVVHDEEIVVPMPQQVAPTPPSSTTSAAASSGSGGSLAPPAPPPPPYPADAALRALYSGPGIGWGGMMRCYIVRRRDGRGPCRVMKSAPNEGTSGGRTAASASSNGEEWDGIVSMVYGQDGDENAGAAAGEACKAAAMAALTGAAGGDGAAAVAAASLLASQSSSALLNALHGPLRGGDVFPWLVRDEPLVGGSDGRPAGGLPMHGHHALFACHRRTPFDHEMPPPAWWADGAVAASSGGHASTGAARLDALYRDAIARGVPIAAGAVVDALLAASSSSLAATSSAARTGSTSTAAVDLHGPCPLHDGSRPVRSVKDVDAFDYRRHFGGYGDSDDEGDFGYIYDDEEDDAVVVIADAAGASDAAAAASPGDAAGDAGTVSAGEVVGMTRRAALVQPHTRTGRGPFPRQPGILPWPVVGGVNAFEAFTAAASTTATVAPLVVKSSSSVVGATASIYGPPGVPLQPVTTIAPDRKRLRRLKRMCTCKRDLFVGPPTALSTATGAIGAIASYLEAMIDPPLHPPTGAADASGVVITTSAPLLGAHVGTAGAVTAGAHVAKGGCTPSGRPYGRRHVFELRREIDDSLIAVAVATDEPGKFIFSASPHILHTGGHSGIHGATGSDPEHYLGVTACNLLGTCITVFDWGLPVDEHAAGPLSLPTGSSTTDVAALLAYNAPGAASTFAAGPSVGGRAAGGSSSRLKPGAAVGPAGPLLGHPMGALAGLGRRELCRINYDTNILASAPNRMTVEIRDYDAYDRLHSAFGSFAVGGAAAGTGSGARWTGSAGGAAGAAAAAAATALAASTLSRVALYGLPQDALADSMGSALVLRTTTAGAVPSNSAAAGAVSSAAGALGAMRIGPAAAGGGGEAGAPAKRLPVPIPVMSAAGALANPADLDLRVCTPSAGFGLGYGATSGVGSWRGMLSNAWNSIVGAAAPSLSVPVAGEEGGSGGEGGDTSASATTVNVTVPPSAILMTRRPRWSEQSQAYTMDFKGRVLRASKKNFQLVAVPMEHVKYDSDIYTGDHTSAPALMFGKVSKDRYSLDFAAGQLGPMQAFAIALTTFASKLAVA